MDEILLSHHLRKHGCNHCSLAFTGDPQNFKVFLFFSSMVRHAFWTWSFLPVRTQVGMSVHKLLSMASSQVLPCDPSKHQKKTPHKRLTTQWLPFLGPLNCPFGKSGPSWSLFQFTLLKPGALLVLGLVLASTPWTPCPHRTPSSLKGTAPFVANIPGPGILPSPAPEPKPLSHRHRGR